MSLSSENEAMLLEVFQEAHRIHHLVCAHGVQQIENAAEQLAAFQLCREDQAIIGPPSVEPLDGQFDKATLVLVEGQ